MAFYPRASYRAKHEAHKMNKAEEAFSWILEKRKLVGEILDWAFEPEKLYLADGTWFTIDFRVILADERVVMYEVKGESKKSKLGRWEEDARVKIKVAAKEHPYIFRAVVVNRKGQLIHEEQIGRV